jgi:hypothetical protein
MTTLQLQRLVDGGQDAIGGMGRSGDVGVGQDGQQLRGRATQDARRIDVTHSACKGRGHRLEGFIGWAGAIGFDQQNAEVALVSMCARQLILEHWPNEAVVEQARGAVDDMEWFSLWVIGLDTA